MFDGYFLTLHEKFILFTFEIKSRKKSHFKRSAAHDNLLFDLKFLEEYRFHDRPPIIRLSPIGKKYIMYRREKRFDGMFLPVVTSVLTSFIISLFK